MMLAMAIRYDDDARPWRSGTTSKTATIRRRAVPPWHQFSPAATWADSTLCVLTLWLQQTKEYIFHKYMSLPSYGKSIEKVMYNSFQWRLL